MGHPRQFKPLPSRPSVNICVSDAGGYLGEYGYLVEYTGLPHDLVELGIATPEMFATRRPGPQCSRDHLGRKFRRNKLGNGRFQIGFYRTREEALQLPGFVDWTDDSLSDQRKIAAVDVGPLLDRFKRRRPDVERARPASREERAALIADLERIIAEKRSRPDVERARPASREERAALIADLERIIAEKRSLARGTRQKSP